jgi:hypothetical protein
MVESAVILALLIYALNSYWAAFAFNFPFRDVGISKTAHDGL